MINRITKSLAYRLPKFYKHILKFKNVRATNKMQSDISVLMMTGNDYIDLLRFSVLSIASTWHSLPKLIVSSDGSISTEKIKHSLSFWKGDLYVQNWEDTLAYHKKKNRPAIIQYAERHPLGKKLAVILHYAEKSPILWIDSDILFFNDFTTFIPTISKDSFCGGSEDFIGGYDNKLLKVIDNDLYQLPNFSSGLMYIFGPELCEEFKLESILNHIHPNYEFLTEQTIFAHMASKSLGVIWDKTIIENFNHDNQKIKGMSIVETVARHYTSNVRHLFWRDVFLKT